jgi:predicted RecA/RadA family phage recombinase
MKNYVSEGKTLTFTAPSGGVKSGDTLVIGVVPVVAHGDADEGESFVGLTCGVFSVPTTVTPTEGAAAYMTTATGAITTTASGGVKVGAFVSAKDSAGYADVWFTGQVV